MLTTQQICYENENCFVLHVVGCFPIILITIIFSLVKFIDKARENKILYCNEREIKGYFKN